MDLRFSVRLAIVPITIQATETISTNTAPIEPGNQQTHHVYIYIYIYEDQTVIMSMCDVKIARVMYVLDRWETEEVCM